MARKHQAPGTGSKILFSGTLEPKVAKKVTDLEMGRVQSQLSSRPGGRDGSGCRVPLGGPLTWGLCLPPPPSSLTHQRRDFGEQPSSSSTAPSTGPHADDADTGTRPKHLFLPNNLFPYPLLEYGL